MWYCLVTMKLLMEELMGTVFEYYTTTEAAEKLGVCGSYVRRICLSESIGRIFGRDRALSELDLEKIQNRIHRPVDRE